MSKLSLLIRRHSLKLSSPASIVTIILIQRGLFALSSTWPLTDQLLIFDFTGSPVPFLPDQIQATYATRISQIEIQSSYHLHSQQRMSLIESRFYARVVRFQKSTLTSHRTVQSISQKAVYNINLGRPITVRHHLVTFINSCN